MCAVITDLVMQVDLSAYTTQNVSEVPEEINVYKVYIAFKYQKALFLL